MLMMFVEHDTLQIACSAAATGRIGQTGAKHKRFLLNRRMYHPVCDSSYPVATNEEEVVAGAWQHFYQAEGAF
jgi:hypothetical protein